MFTNKSKINEPRTNPTQETKPMTPPPEPISQSPSKSPRKPEQKMAPSVLSQDLFIKGNLRSSNDIKVEGQIEGDVRAKLLTIGESATVRGQMVAEEVVVNGRIIGQVRGLRVRLNSSARVEGDIIHEIIAIESGAHFEGSVKRQENPLSNLGGSDKKPQTGTPQKKPAGEPPKQN